MPGADAAGEPGGDEPTPEELAAIEPEVLADDAPLPAASAGSLVVADPVRRYLQEIRQFQPLTPDEERELAVRFHETGDVQAAYRLVTAHLRLVVRIAFEFKRTWLNLLDLVQEGNVGLLLAIRKFDPYRGIRLSTYASWWIRAYIIKFLLDNWRLVKVGTTNARRRLLFNLRKEKEALLAQGIAPVPKLLAERLNVSEQDVIEVDRSLGASDLSLEAPTGPDSDRVVGDTLAASGPAADEQLVEEEGRELLRRKLAEFEATLTDRERVVFRERLLSEDKATLRELGERFGLTREGLRQVEKRILGRLRPFLAADRALLQAVNVPVEDESGPPGAPRG